jgi:hypothetical protein
MKAYIYKLTGGGMTYYGSTKRNVDLRIREHINDYNGYKRGKRNYNSSSFKIIGLGKDNFKYEIIETFETDDKDVIRGVEDFYISNFECINNFRAYITEEEYKEKERLRNKKKNSQRVKCPTCNLEMNYSSLTRHKKNKH